jgi:hypothetical protein
VSGIWQFGLTDAIQVLKPHVADGGDLDWEHHIAETPRDLWRVRGMVSPELGSEAVVLWKAAGGAVPYGL